MTAPSFFGLFAPKATAKALLDRVAEATRTAIADQELQRIYIASGFEPHANSSPEGFMRTIEEELNRWSPVVKAIGLKLD